MSTRQYGVMTDNVALLGTGLRLPRGEVVVLTRATNLPAPKDRQYFARPRGAFWRCDSMWRNPEDSILVDLGDAVLVTPRQKHAYLMMRRRYQRPPDEVSFLAFDGPVLMCRYDQLWLGIEPDGYTHT